jgi:hypothetical protein
LSVPDLAKIECPLRLLPIALRFFKPPIEYLTMCGISPRTISDSVFFADVASCSITCLTIMAPISDCVAARRHVAFWDQDGLGAFLDGVFLRRRTASEVTVANFAM